MKLSEVAEKLGAELDGDGNIEITAVAGLKEAEAGDVSFLANPKYAAQVADTSASAVIVPMDWERDASCALLRVENSDQAFSEAAQLFYEEPPRPAPGVHPTAVVAESAVLGKEVSIGAHCVIEDGVVIGDRTVISSNCCVAYKTVIGEDCFFYPLVSIREFTEIGKRVILHNGVVIGSDGFGYALQKDGSRTKIPQIGKVVLGDDVEVGANSAIDRARFGKTRIGKGTKIDNLVQVGHNVVIGENSVLCGLVGIAGSSNIGSRVILAGQSGVGGHLDVGDGAIIGGKAGVMKDVAAGEFVLGCPAIPHIQFKKGSAYQFQVPKLREKIKALEAKVAELEQKN